MLLSYLLQCISLHYYALLLFVEPCLDGIKMAHNHGAELFIYPVAVSTEAGHIGGTAPVREPFINKYCLAVRLFIYLSLNGNEIFSVIQPAQFYIHVHTSTCLSTSTSTILHTCTYLYLCVDQQIATLGLFCSLFKRPFKINSSRAYTTTRDLNKNDMSEYMYMCCYMLSRLPVCPLI